MKAQIDCATPTPSADFLNSINPNAKLLPSNDAVVQLYFHVVRRNNGTGNVAVSDVLQGFNSLQYQFNAVNICFAYMGTDFIDDNSLFSFTSSDESNLISNNPHSNAIDIYVITNEGGGPTYPYNGYAIGGNPGKILIVTRQGMTYGGTSLAHELGHCMGLYHTFETYFCSESTNGSNCSSCGDLVCDTPADYDFLGNGMNPNNQVNGSCNYTCGMGYSPLTNNIMSYYQNCRTAFTFYQGDRMRTTIANSSVLQQCLIPANLTLTQTYPLTVNFGFNTFTYYNPIFIAKNKVQTYSNFVVNAAVLPNVTTVGLIAEQDIEMLPGFEAHQGAYFAAVISQICPPSIAFRTNVQQSNNYLNDIYIQNPNQYDNITGEVKQSLFKGNYSNEVFNITPNPNNGEFKLTLNNNNELPKSITIRDYQGKEVKTINNPTEYELNIDLKSLNNGLFIITASYNDAIMSKRIIKQ